MARHRKILIYLAAAGAFVLTAYLTKPGQRAGARVEPVRQATVGKKEVMAAKPQETLLAAASAAGPGEGGSSEKEHDENAVVRPGKGEGVGSGVKGQGSGQHARILADPNWAAPVELGFSDFKRLRRHFRRQKGFAPADSKKLHGAAVLARGAVMPIDAGPKSGKMSRFWLANPMVVMAGCVFCNPPTMADLIFVSTPKGAPLEVDRERLYRGVVYTKLLGRLRLGPHTSSDGVEYLFSLELKERRE